MIDKTIFEIASKSKNIGSLNKCTHYSKVKNSMCGDEIKIYLIIKRGKIIKFKYEGKSCLYSQASASLLSENLKNKEAKKIEILLKDAPKLFNNGKERISDKTLKKFFKIINKNNIARKECLMLPIKATLKALNK